ncbi:MAG: low specificity L-threonine aldolase [Oscillospiraceae bacterium]|nr:low specificity L-threonine aldolase [Oscillospiraceae bacterium]
MQHGVLEAQPTHFFISDNASPAHPRVMEALAAANLGHAPSYGADPYTQAAEAAFDRLFGRKVRTFFVFNGTGANSAALSALARPYQSILCADTAHIHCDECGAPERMSGAKLQPIPSTDGKLRPGQLSPYMPYLGVMHHAQPAVLSITQATELGTVYTQEELCALTRFAHAHTLKVHMDGARIANAVASLGCTLAELTWQAGVDVLCFGGTKNGLLFGEVVVFFDDALAEAFAYIRKNCGQLASKMRYIAAQYLALLQDDLWLQNAVRANAMCKRLADGLVGLPGVCLTQPAQANELFVRMPRQAVEPLQRVRPFIMWDAEQGVARLVTSWDTDEADVDAFLDACRKVIV